MRDKDGDYRITGRMDDVINVSGKRLGTAEIEDAMVTYYYERVMPALLVTHLFVKDYFAIFQCAG